MFSTLSKTKLKFSVTFIFSSACDLNLDWSEILSSGKGLLDNNTDMKLITGSFDNTALPVLRGIISYFNQYTLINPLPNEKILDWSKLKAFADDKINVT